MPIHEADPWRLQYFAHLETDGWPAFLVYRLPFHENLAAELHAMPPGGLRLAVVNGFDLAAASSARARLKGHFPEKRPGPLALKGEGLHRLRLRPNKDTFDFNLSSLVYIGRHQRRGFPRGN